MSQLDLFNGTSEPPSMPTREDCIALLLQEEKIRHSDLALANILNNNKVDDALYIFLLLFRAQLNQHSCLALEDINWLNPFGVNDSTLSAHPFIWQNNDYAQLWQSLETHHAVGEGKPLQLFANKLYTTRMADYEQTLAQRFLAMQAMPITIDDQKLKALLTAYFGQSDHEIDWQKVACAIAATRGFCVLTGGPGTGKTTTVTKLLAILQSLYVNAPLTIKLVAPTGKAAARLSESILGAKTQLKLEQHIKDLIPEQAQTIHRLLGVIPHSNKYRYDQNNLLHLDVLIVDEASMVDLSLMAKLIHALPKHARLILLGDKDQLASVDTGSVMSDLCQGLVFDEQPAYSIEQATRLNALCFNQQSRISSQKSVFALADSIAFLQKSFRFNASSGIGQLAMSINNNDSKKLKQTIEKGYGDLHLYDLTGENYQDLIERCAIQYSQYLTLLANKANPKQVHHAFAQFQVLAAVKEGPYGVHVLNKRIEQALTTKNLINPIARYYDGLPIMITHNDYQLKLFNGDIGILIRDKNNQLKAVFIDEQGTERAFYPARLPAHDKVYVMTIHKSQGSEFVHTTMILPPAQQASLGINRQLVYTGITRAKKIFELVAQPKVLNLAMHNGVTRGSGLTDRLNSNEIK